MNRAADIEARNSMGETPLHIASKLGIVEAVEFLLDNGADIEAKDNLGNTPLLLSATPTNYLFSPVKYLSYCCGEVRR